MKLSSLVQTRTSKVMVVLSIGAIVISWFAYQFSVMYDWPFRLHSQYPLKGTGLSISPDNTTLVCASPPGGRGVIYLMDIDSKETKRLTQHIDEEGHPCFSPDGSEIAFDRVTDKCGHIWMMDRDGSHPKQLTSGSNYDSNPIFSADGQSLWFVRMPQGTRLLYEYEMDLTGHHQREVKTRNGPAGLFPTFCPKSTLVFYEGQDGIRCMDQDKGTDRFICKGESPSVSSDGRSLAWIVYGSQDKELWQMDVDGEHIHKVSNGDLGDIENLVFSADDCYIYFSRPGQSADDRATEEICRIKTDGSDFTTIAVVH